MGPDASIDRLLIAETFSLEPLESPLVGQLHATDTAVVDPDEPWC